MYETHISTYMRALAQRSGKNVELTRKVIPRRNTWKTTGSGQRRTHAHPRARTRWHAQWHALVTLYHANICLIFNSLLLCWAIFRYMNITSKSTKISNGKVCFRTNMKDKSMSWTCSNPRPPQADFVVDPSSKTLLSSPTPKWYPVPFRFFLKILFCSLAFFFTVSSCLKKIYLPP